MPRPPCTRLTLLFAMLAAPLLAAPAPRPEPSLRDAFAQKFAIGFGTGVTDAPRSALLRHHASSLTCENVLKPRALRPTPDTFAWEKADAWLAWCESLSLEPVGHTLVWSYMMPAWLLDQARAGTLSKADALAWQDAHIRAVLARHGDRIRTWDVVNEALADGPSTDAYLHSDPWLDLVGEDGLVAAFRSARAAAPRAKLLYNDYNLEHPAKLARLLRLLNRLETEGLRPDAIGIQGHGNIHDDFPALLDSALPRLHAAGYPVHLTELDVGIYAWAGGADIQQGNASSSAPVYAELTPELHQRLADRYREIFAVLLRHDVAIERVAFWNTDDGNSWLNHWPVKNRPNHPLLFDRQLRPKPAFHAILP